MRRSLSVLAWLTCTVLVVALVCCAGAIQAQEITATLSGNVKDEAGAVVPGATVTAAHLRTGAQRATQSTASGVFFFNGLPTGDYRVTVELQGFKKYQVPSLSLHVNDKVNLDVTLQVGGLTEEVTVQADAVQLQTETAEVSNLVGAAQMEALPLNGRGFNQLVDIVPGVAPDQGRVNGGVGLFSDTAVSINGNLSNSNLYLIDGEYNLDSGANGNLLVTPSMDAIEEFKVLRNNYSAEFGGATGGVVNVITKSGSQQFHGSAYDYARNDALDATDPFLRAAGEQKSNLSQHNFGLTLGGPFWLPGKYNQDRTSDFLFLSFEGRRETRGHTATDTVPTTRQRQGILDPQCAAHSPGCVPQADDPQEKVLNEPNVIPSRIDPNAKAFLARYPLPNASYDDHGFNYITSADTKTDDDQLLARWDHHFGSKAVLTLRYVQMVQNLDGITNQLFGGSDTFPSVNRDWEWKGKNAIAKLTLTLTPRLVNDFQFGYSSNALSYVTGRTADPALASRAGFTYTELFPETSGSFPTLDGVEGFGNLSNSAPFDNRTDNFQIKDDVAYSFGRHNLRAGAFVRVNHKREPANGGGNYTAGTFTFATFEDLLLGNAASYSEEETQNDVFDRSHDVALYLQDTWKIAPGLTLDLGLRYQYLNQIYSAKDNIANFRPGKYDPSRCSEAAFTPDGLIDPTLCDTSNGLVTPRTPGVGRSTLNDYYDGIEPRVGFAWQPKSSGRLVIRGGYGIFHGRDAVSQTSLLGAFPPNDRVASLNNVAFSDLAPFNPDVPQPSLSLFALDQNFKSPVSRQFSVGFQLQLVKDAAIEVNYVGGRGKHLGRNRDINQVPDADRLGVAEGLINPDSVRPYLGYNFVNMNERVGWSHYDALQVFMSKRMSHGVEFQLAYTYSRNRSNTANQDTEFGGFPIQNAYDPGSEVGPTNQDQPHSFIANYIVELPFFKQSTGWKKVAFGGWHVVGITTLRSGLPAAVCMDQDIAGTGTPGYACLRPDVTGDPNLPRGDRTANEWFNTAAFSVPAPGTFGNAGRNIVRLPGVNNWDMSLYKNFEIPWFGGALASKNATLQLRADCFNVFNHTQYNSVDTTFVTSESAESSFGVVTGARSPREVQLAVKLMW